MIRVIDLFSGIGGFSLGLQMAGGFRTVQFVEIDPFCRRSLGNAVVPQVVAEIGRAILSASATQARRSRGPRRSTRTSAG